MVKIGAELPQVIPKIKLGIRFFGPPCIYSMFEITAVLYFPIITTQRLYQLMHYTRYGNSVFAKFIQYLWAIWFTGCA